MQAPRSRAAPALALTALPLRSRRPSAARRCRRCAQQPQAALQAFEAFPAQPHCEVHSQQLQCSYSLKAAAAVAIPAEAPRDSGLAPQWIDAAAALAGIAIVAAQLADVAGELALPLGRPPAHLSGACPAFGRRGSARSDAGNIGAHSSPCPAPPLAAGPLDFSSNMAGAVACGLAGMGLQWLLEQGCAALKARCCASAGPHAAEAPAPAELRWLGALLDLRTGLPQVDTVLKGASAVVGLCEVALIASDWWRGHPPLVAGTLGRMASGL